MIQNPARNTLKSIDYWYLQTNLSQLERMRALEYLTRHHQNFKSKIFIAHCCANEEKQKKLIDILENKNDSIAESCIKFLTRYQLESAVHKRIPHPNLLAIQYIGNPAILSSPKVAIIGSRKPTLYGREQAYRFAKELALAGCTVVSGGAIGIDTIAQEVALQHGNSCCILGNGLQNPYPSSNHILFQKLKKSPQGLIFSEFPMQERAHKWNFPQRNITIASLADFVLVIEATLTSGSLITANAACELGVDVGAVPGCIDNMNSEGTNELIKNGAFCIQNSQDILERLNSLYRNV
ncbi:DNA-processing protein DprA [Fluviispira multicolorata]|uniref:Smf/DprA SLOG domain-containing protein n=1 Tax=Fluviispira multicolorata TaxID=2654512 RepID=A0A833JFN0_9BACT|nr:DNA-processing protein DprA [Fluviispira multicolorata]KAB8033483.1 hypothetical protein GCL57_01915 [Fluviispira multicolorata]